MRKLSIAWVAVLAILIYMSVIHRGTSKVFYGIADTQELVINSENAVEVKKIHVVAGQKINSGDTLLQLNDPDLAKDINDLTQEIYKLKSDKQDIIRDLTLQIAELEAQYELNRKSMSDLKSFSKEDKSSQDITGTAPIKVQIASLKRELWRVRNDQKNKTVAPSTRYAASRQNSQVTEETQISFLEDELKNLNEKRKKLIVFAQINGVIGSVNYKEGEKVSPFMPIVTLHTKTPSYVKGYIHENVYTAVRMNQLVNVRSQVNSKDNVTGVVVGVGARIVEYPIQLRKIQEMLMWGREVVIKIPEENNFILGEKVLIRPLSKTVSSSDSLVGEISLTPKAFAGTADAMNTASCQSAARPQAADIMVDANVQIKKPIEASGIAYLSDIASYVVISDDTDKKKPYLFLMDSTYTIYKKVLISGVEQMDDMESVTIDERGAVYVMSSQSVNKRDERSILRTLLVRIQRSRDSFAANGKVSIHALLKAVSGIKSDNPAVGFIREGITGDLLDIEGMAVRQNRLYLGFKAPLMDKKAVVLELADIHKIFATGKLQPSQCRIWNALPLFNDKQTLPGGVSDLFFQGDDCFILSVAEDNTGATQRKNGSFWCFNIKDNTLKMIDMFSQMQPEGITGNSTTKEIVIAFDQGSNSNSQILTRKGLL
ncbi:MAG: DUF3616 domain-containing protein [Chitinivibrionales bacterium]|nr:DUF3616 domain-containing protein [Chitinivibrionales bacterium]